jgi:hypothetical protein
MNENKSLPVVNPPLKSPPPPPSPAPNPCSIYELTNRRCHWPLGKVSDVAALYCGAKAVRGCPWCAHHLMIAHPTSTSKGMRKP